MDLTNEQNGRAQAHAPEKSYALGMRWTPAESIYVGLDVNGKAILLFGFTQQSVFVYTLANLVIGYEEEQWN